MGHAVGDVDRGESSSTKSMRTNASYTGRKGDVGHLRCTGDEILGDNLHMLADNHGLQTRPITIIR